MLVIWGQKSRSTNSVILKLLSIGIHRKNIKAVSQVQYSKLIVQVKLSDRRTMSISKPVFFKPFNLWVIKSVLVNRSTCQYQRGIEIWKTSFLNDHTQRQEYPVTWLNVDKNTNIIKTSISKSEKEIFLKDTWSC